QHVQGGGDVDVGRVQPAVLFDAVVRQQVGQGALALAVPVHPAVDHQRVDERGDVVAQPGGEGGQAQPGQFTVEDREIEAAVESDDGHVPGQAVGEHRGDLVEGGGRLHAVGPGVLG